jgi:hypothetical protein
MSVLLVYQSSTTYRFLKDANKFVLKMYRLSYQLEYSFASQEFNYALL